MDTHSPYFTNAYFDSMAFVMLRMIQNWSGSQTDLEKEVRILCEIIYEDGQHSVKETRGKIN